MSSARRQLRQLRRHVVPAWWRDAKLGIFVHWTPASVPAFAPTDVEIGDLLTSDDPAALSRAPYSEWYENSLRFPDSPVARHHAATYGDRPYTAFAADWEAGLDDWDPDDWAARFAATGAGYVVLVAKHSDGYCLWPTAVTNPNRSGWSCRRDVVGEMAEAVRGAGMRFGLYYCGGFDWSFEDRPIGTMGDVAAAVPQGAYPTYADAQVRELIRRYRPSVLWGDVAWPGRAPDLWDLFAAYYAAVPDGVINDRWLPWSPALARAIRSEPVRRAVAVGARRAARRDGGLIPPKPPHFDVRTPEYTTFPHIEPTAWECVRGMDRSFGYNASSTADDLIGHDELLWLLADTVAKGGNLLLNVGPRGVDATIPDEQLTRLQWLADWLPAHGAAVLATRPWVVAGDATAEGRPLRYTARGSTVFALVGGEPDPAAAGDADFPGGDPGVAPITLAEVEATPTTTVTTLAGDRLRWRSTPAGLQVDRPATGRADDAAGGPSVVALHDVAARPRPG
ncbi:MAG: alpha-L-fucosidase [Acidimicrobiales bacterium]